MKRLILHSLPVLVCACLPPPTVGTVEDTGECTLEPWYNDLDADGHGDESSLSMRCTPVSGQVDVGDDCDDQDASVWAWDEAWTDQDLDGYGDTSYEVRICGAPSAGTSQTGGDCDDTRDEVYPGAPLICGDEVDNNCDGQTDCSIPAGTLGPSDASATIEGQDSEELGSALAISQDLTGDGLPDLLVGAPATAVAPSSAGRVYLFSDPAQEDLYAADGVLITGAVDGDGAGGALAAADIDGDGLDDGVIGASTGGEGQEGSAYVVFGPVSGAVAVAEEAAALLMGEAAGDLAGNAVLADASSLDGLFVGAPGNDLGGSNAGAVYRVTGPLSPGTTALSTSAGILRGAAAADKLGAALSTGGDLDGDGVSELMVGAPSGHVEADGGAEHGVVYLVSSAFSADQLVSDAANAWIYGPSASILFGTALAAAGDVDGDGAADLLIGAPNSDPAGGVNAGEVWLLSGPAAASAITGASADDLSPLCTFEGDAPYQQLGSVVAGLGDLDEDGADDIGLGNPTYTGSEAGDPDEVGAVFLWYGGVSGIQSPREADVLFLGDSAYAHLGAALRSLGDINQLGVPDLAIGAPGDPETSATASAAYLLLGDGI